MKRYMVAALVALVVPLAPAHATFETVEHKMAAASAAEQAKGHMRKAFGRTSLTSGEYLWKKGRQAGGQVTRVVISLPDQIAYAYQNEELIGVSTISSGKSGNETPTGIFPILEKKRDHRSIKYENAPMPYMQRLDWYGIALHGGRLPGYPASHGCVRLPEQFASTLFSLTRVGTEVLIGAPQPGMKPSYQDSRELRFD
jgi:lipoprotein-anchoring transpeptidase ErfK/SrfK